MSVYSKKRNDGTRAWYYDFMYKGQKYYGRGGTTRSQALRTQEKIRTEVINGEYELKRNIGNPTLEEFSEKFLECITKHRSYKRYVIVVMHLNKFFGKSKKLMAIRPVDIEHYKSWRKSVSNATINRELACLKRMYNLAIQWGDVLTNPVQNIKFLHEPPKKDRYVTKQEAAKLIDAAADYFKPFLVTAFNTGMRLQELLGLKWDMINFWDTGGEIELLYTKNGKKRDIPLNETMKKLLLEIERKSEYVFLGIRGEPLKSVRKPVATAIRRAGIETATFHDFRHSWASWMSEAGVDPYTIMEIGGWSSLKILERYLHRTRLERQNAVNKLDGVLNSRNIHENVNILKLRRKVNGI